MGELIDLTGLRFGTLVVLSRATNDKHGHAMWKCECDCGAVKTAMSSNLTRGLTKSCGSSKHHKSTLIDLSGKVFNRLTAISRATNRPNSKDTRWHCVCSCGNKVVVSGSHLKTGHTKSCGCLKIEKDPSAFSGTKLYKVWAGMRSRCYNPKLKEYKYYGARGVDILFTCFEDFSHWASVSGYNSSLTIDRVDNNGPYSRDNCQWATMAQQMRNTRHNVMITHPETGESLCARDWSERLGGDKALVSARIRRGMNPSKAITTPLNRI